MKALKAVAMACVLLAGCQPSSDWNTDEAALRRLLQQSGALAPVEMKRWDTAQADDRVPIVEFRGRDVVFQLARYLALRDCVIAEFRVRGSATPRTTAAMREDLQQELTAVLPDKVQLHDHASCDKAL